MDTRLIHLLIHEHLLTILLLLHIVLLLYSIWFIIFESLFRIRVANIQPRIVICWSFEQTCIRIVIWIWWSHCYTVSLIVIIFILIEISLTLSLLVLYSMRNCIWLLSSWASLSNCFALNIYIFVIIVIFLSSLKCFRLFFYNI